MRDLQSYWGLMQQLLKTAEAESVTASSGLYDDLGLDSLQAYELIIMTEQLAGLDLPPPEVPEIYTLGDAYAYYLQCVSAAEGEDESLWPE